MSGVKRYAPIDLVDKGLAYGKVVLASDYEQLHLANRRLESEVARLKKPALVTVEELTMIIRSYYPNEPVRSIVVGDTYVFGSGRRYKASTLEQIATASTSHGDLIKDAD